MKRSRTIYKNATVYRTDKKELGRFDVAVRDGKIEAVEAVIEPMEPEEQVIDLSGLTLLPGLVDVHVHMREPGFSEKETYATGTAAAAHGGFTAICPMPNLNPAPDSSETLAVQERMIEEQAVVKVYPIGCITIGQKGGGTLVDFAGIESRVAGFSDDGRGVQEDALMEEAMRRCAVVDRPIVAHCEVEELIKGGYIHDGEYCKAHGHKGICSESEWLQVKRDIEYSERTGCQYHVCHVSTKESVELIRQAKAKGLRVSGETAPHYLLLTDVEIEEDGRFKMNPPIRSKEDQEALFKGVMDGTLECIATDHAPHTAEEKSRGLAGSNMGIVGLETAFPLMYKYFVVAGKMYLEHLMDLMANNPRRLFRIDGGTAVGDSADFVVMDLDAKYKVDPETFLSKGRATPFTGWDVQGKTMLTVVSGKHVYVDNKMSERL
ncbi:dihydroorotase [Porphyromonas canoris]|uniref:dihydroorotase n=1 Tax=Porphyromonas canoris TaxID=36875 RepID=UPI00051CCA60|nr:dihydroorotase [Porphyromonas canoris]KGL53430.1 dihydroorotase [Porphyromonas canoris]